MYALATKLQELRVKYEGEPIGGNDWLKVDSNKQSGQVSKSEY